MAVMNFDLEDGLPPVSFNLKFDDAERFSTFMSEIDEIVRDLQALKRELNLSRASEKKAAEHNVKLTEENVNLRRKIDWLALQSLGHQNGADSAVAAIEFALSDDGGCEAVTFLNLWLHGDFDAIRREWENVPDAVFMGADPLCPVDEVKSREQIHFGLWEVES